MASTHQTALQRPVFGPTWQPRRDEGSYHDDQQRLRELGLGDDAEEAELDVTIEGLPPGQQQAVLNAFPGARRFHLC